MAETKKKAKSQKGRTKAKPDTDNPNENPLLHVENTADFIIETGNLLQDTDLLIFHGYEQFDMKKDKDLRYFEYVCIARFRFAFIIPILESGLSAKDVFEMIKHCLHNKLLINAPTFDNIFDIEIVYTGYVKYK